MTNQARLEAMSKLDADLVRAYHVRWEQSLSSRNEEPREPVAPNVEVVAARWEKELDRAGIEKAVFFTSTEAHDETIRFISLNPDRFIGYTTFDPTNSRNADLLRTLAEKDGIKGLKLYPMAQHFHVNNPDCFPVYRICQEKKLPVIIHFGLSINATHDLSYGNPLDLATPALCFPAVKWIIPHFGAGFLREALLVAAQYHNVYFDTSSSNSWIRYSAPPLTMHDLFKYTYEALGAKRILFGSDSSYFPRGYRDKILDQQLAIFNMLDLSQDEIDDVFCGNIENILGLVS
jgi:predicted TIM-barrel fold metal-dependent hydrolase